MKHIKLHFRKEKGKREEKREADVSWEDRSFGRRVRNRGQFEVALVPNCFVVPTSCP